MQSWFDWIVARRLKAEEEQNQVSVLNSDKLPEAIADALRLLDADTSTSLQSIIEQTDRSEFSTKSRLAIEKLESLFRFYQSDLIDKGHAWYSTLPRETKEQYWKHVTLDSLFTNERWIRYVDRHEETNYTLLRQIRNELKFKTKSKSNGVNKTVISDILSAEWDRLPLSSSLQTVFRDIVSYADKTKLAKESTNQKKKALDDMETTKVSLNELKRVIDKCSNEIKKIQLKPRPPDNSMILTEISRYRSLAIDNSKQSNDIEREISKYQKKLEDKAKIPNPVDYNDHFRQLEAYVDQSHTRFVVNSLFQLCLIAKHRIEQYPEISNKFTKESRCIVQQLDMLIEMYKEEKEKSIDSSVTCLVQNFIGDIHQRDADRIICRMLDELLIQLKESNASWTDIFATKWREKILSVLDNYEMQANAHKNKNINPFPRSEQERYDQQVQPVLKKIQEDLLRGSLKPQIEVLSHLDKQINNNLLGIVKESINVTEAEIQLTNARSAFEVPTILNKISTERIPHDALERKPEELKDVETWKDLIEYVNQL